MMIDLVNEATDLGHHFPDEPEHTLLGQWIWRETYQCTQCGAAIRLFYQDDGQEAYQGRSDRGTHAPCPGLLSTHLDEHDEKGDDHGYDNTTTILHA